MPAETTLDIEQPAQLEEYLRATGRVRPSERLIMRPLAGGVSNRTMWVERIDREAGQPDAAGGWVIKQALAQLRVKVEWFSDPSRIEREALGLEHLAQLAPRGAITPLLFVDRENHLLAMRAVPQPHENWKNMLLVGRLSHRHVDQFGRLLGTIHARAFARPELSDVFAERRFFESLRIEPYYAYTAQEVPQAREFIASLIDDTRRRLITLVHGDYSPKNILIHHGHMVLLDHEVIHWGDPAFDLGFSMAHFLSKSHHLARLRREFAAAALRYWSVYRQTIGGVPWAGDLESFAVRHTLGCLLARVAGRSQLEYLSAEAKDRQHRVVAALMQQPIVTLSALVERFEESL